MQKKCVVAATGMHLLLAVVLVVGPGFLSPTAKTVDATPITFVPSIFVDGPPGGGNPKAGQPVSAPPKPAPPAPKVEEPAAPPEPVKTKVDKPEPKEETKDPDAFSEKTEKSHKPQISLKQVTRTHKRVQSEDADADAKAQEREAYARKQQLASLIGRAASDIKSGTGAATTVAGDAGINGGGPAYASYAAWVLTVFDDAWVAPDDATSEDSTVRVRVVIESDGSVADYRIIERSGDPAVDASVQRALERVARSGMGKPFPASMKDKKRTYIIPFNLKNKRGNA